MKSLTPLAIVLVLQIAVMVAVYGIHRVEWRARATEFAASYVQLQCENNAPGLDWLPPESHPSPRHDRQL